MGPGGVFGNEFLQEESGRYGTRIAPGVLQVGEFVLEGVGVFLFERHAPELFAAGFAAVDDLQGKVVVVAEKSGYRIAEGTDHGSGEGGKVHNVGSPDEARFGKSVGEDQAAFGVGVVHHDGLAVFRLEDIAGQNRFVADGVFGQAAHGTHLDGEFQGGNGLDGGQRGGCSAHVADHLGHGLGGFEAESAGVEGKALSDDDQVVAGGAAFFTCGFACRFARRKFRAVVAEGNHVGLVGAALAHSHVTHEAFLFQLFHVPHLDGKTRRVLGDSLCIFYEGGWVEVRGAGVDQVSCQGDGLLLYGHFFGDFLKGSGTVTGHDLEGHLEIFFLLALVGVELVVGVMEPVEYGLELFVGGVGQKQAHAGYLPFHGPLGQAVGRHTQVVKCRNPALLGGIHKEGVASVDFKEFQVFEGPIFDALQHGFHLGFTLGGKHL